MRKIIPYILLLFFTISCKDKDDNISSRQYDFEIEDFIWEGLNTYYYWQNSISDLADNRFDSQKSYASFLSRFNANHDLLFESLLSENDRFSWIMSDYTALENQLRRVYKTDCHPHSIAYRTNPLFCVSTLQCLAGRHGYSNGR